MKIRQKTKIVATVGPACDSVEILKEMIEAGVSVVRINLSFGTDATQGERVARIRQAADELGAYVAVMADTRGIEIRTGMLESDSIELAEGEDFILYCENRVGGREGVSVSYGGLYQEVKAGSPILLDDGAIELVVTKIEKSNILCRVVFGGVLRQNKGVNLPGTQLSLSAVSPENRAEVMREIGFVAEHGIEYLAASFIQSAGDIHRLREVQAEFEVEVPIIAKIENQAGVRNLEEIAAAADGVMVARGDLGVELPLAEVPGVQKRIIHTTVSLGKPVITATQMLSSMETSPRPTRAEASDVANAVLDGSSAVMLSGETAIGKYPVKAVQTMAELAERAEASLAEYGFLQMVHSNPSNQVTDAVSLATIGMVNRLGAKAILSLTETGFTPRMISRHRPECPIIAVTTSAVVARKLALNWGVLPLLHTGKENDDAKIRCGIERASELGYLRSGDLVLIITGTPQTAGGTNSIRVMTIE
jgi:pyruvate kinase